MVVVAAIGVVLYLVGAILMLWRWLAPNGPLESVDAIGVHSGPDFENWLRAQKAFEVWKRIASEWIKPGIYCMGRATLELRSYLESLLIEDRQSTAFVRGTGRSNNTFDNLSVLRDSLAMLPFVRDIALVSSGYHRFRVERTGKRAGLSVTFQKAPSRSVFHILLEPIAIIADLLPIRRHVYDVVRSVRTK